MLPAAVYSYLVRCGVDEATREDLFRVSPAFTALPRAIGRSDR
jgi:hypothetical protein